LPALLPTRTIGCQWCSPRLMKRTGPLRARFALPGGRPLSPLPSSLRATLRRRPNGLPTGWRGARMEAQKGTSDMSTTTGVIDSPSAAAGGVREALTIDVGDSPDALMRVLMVLRRRRCRVTSLEFVAADRHYPGRLFVRIVAPPASVHCVPSWLTGLVDVTAVEATFQ
jgi:acetolactate synthase regulatory subunit